MLKNNWIFLMLIFLLISCGKKPKVQEVVVDQSENQPFRVKVERFDQAFFQLNPNDPDSGIISLLNAYSPFFELYSTGILKLGEPGTAEFKKNLALFLTDSVMNEMKDSVQLKFSDLNWLENQLTIGFSNYKEQFPNRDIPRVIASTTGFNQSIIIGDSVIGIGLDKYLGSKCSFYQHLNFPNYLRSDMIPERIPRDVMYALGMAEFPYNDSVDNLLSNMIFEGRALFFIQHLMPNLPDSLLLGYSPRQLKWCKTSEKAMWTFLAEQRLLFNQDRLMIKKFIGEARFTTAFTEESPGKAGVWIGWQIVKSYMNNNREVTLSQLMNAEDYQLIMRQSGYNP